MFENEWAHPVASPSVSAVLHLGVELRLGDRVRLWPMQGADLMDLALAGKVAIIESIEQDFENQIRLVVVIDDDPGRDIGWLRRPGNRFFFSLDEVEPMSLLDDSAI